MSVPLAAAGVLVVLWLGTYLWKILLQGRSRKLWRHTNGLVALFLVISYFLYM